LVYRLDRLVLLLDTGSTTAVRRTAAQQLGEIQKQHPGELYNLLSRVNTPNLHKETITKYISLTNFLIGCSPLKK
jgi:hypothetical protein